MGPMNSWFDQLEWIVDKDRIVRCQCLRLERLEADLEAFFGEAIRVPRENTTRTRYDYRSMYTDELREIVGATFARDISHFGFEFETTATRNVVQT